MKRLVLSSMIITLVTTLAAPAGAVFATEPPPIQPQEAAVAVESSEAVPNPSGANESVSSVDPDEPREVPAVAQALTPSADEKAGDTAAPAPASPNTPPAQFMGVESVVGEPPVEATPPADPALVPQRDVYVYSFEATQRLGFVELYNSSETKTQSINGWQMNVYFDDESMCEIKLQGYIFPETHVLLAQEGAVSGVQHAQIFSCGEVEGTVRKIEVYDGAQLVERLTPSITPEASIWVRKNTTKPYRTGEFSQDFKQATDYSPTDGFWYNLPPAPGITFLEILVQPRNCTPADLDPTCYDFVKVQNTSDQPIDLSMYRLRTGFVNATSSTSNTTYFSLVLQKGEVRTLTHGRSGERLSITANDGTVWFEDAEGIVAYPTDVSPYVDSSLSSTRGRSWARDQASQGWRWAIPSPLSVENKFPEPLPLKESGSDAGPKPCNADQFRNPETGRCKKTASTATLTPCREGQQRNPETNRCRSVATLTSSLQPCNADQFRNPETNRCKKITSAATGLQDCGPGRERNALTNRCRNIAATTPPTADFSVEPIREPASVFIGWAVMGGVALLALGYAGWEWREEIGRLVRRVPGIGRLLK